MPRDVELISAPISPPRRTTIRLTNGVEITRNPLFLPTESAAMVLACGLISEITAGYRHRG